METVGNSFKKFGSKKEKRGSLVAERAHGVEEGICGEGRTGIQSTHGGKGLWWEE